MLFSLARLLMPATVLEIGVGGAASTIAFAEAIRLNGRGQLISIDSDEGLIQHAQLLLNAHRLNPFATIIRGQSADPETKKLVAAKATQVDILFIDGDHSFAGCSSDSAMYRSLLAPAGLVIFHDTGTFPSSQAGLVAKLPLDAGESDPEWNREGTAIYHRPNVKVMPISA